MVNFFDFIKKRDDYGHPVGMTFKGEGTYQTFRGGLISLAVNCYLVYYLVDAFIPVGLGEISTFQPQTRYFNTTEEVYNPFEAGFNFAVGFSQRLDPYVATLSLSYTEKTWADDGTQDKQKTDVPLRPCIEGGGFPLNSPRTNLYMYCPYNLNVSFTGDYFANKF
jgi:hypothetical protein